VADHFKFLILHSGLVSVCQEAVPVDSSQSAALPS